MGSKGKLRIVQRGHSAYCPGCQDYHWIPDTWQFNGNYDHPTFTPSLLVRGYSERLKQDYVCHSFITNGQWCYCGDCTHELNGAIAPMVDEVNA